MKTKLFTLALIACSSLILSSCSDDSPKPSDEDDKNTQAEYFITCEIDGVAYSAKTVSATRNTVNEPNSLTIIGSESANPPMLQFTTTESNIGFEPGLNVTCNESSFPEQFASYNASQSEVFTTSDDANGISLYFSKISYVEGGEAEGSFAGSMSDFDGNPIQVTNGKFKVKFVN
jgi:hypothetical protein